MENNIIITSTVSITLSELSFRFSRSGGHGGQNVNKVETKVELLFDVAHSPSLTEEQREHVLKKLQSRIDSEGMLSIVSQESRSQSKNKALAIERFIEVMKEGLKKKKKRKKTAVPETVKEERLLSKKHRGEIKRLRKVKHREHE